MLDEVRDVVEGGGGGLMEGEAIGVGGAVAGEDRLDGEVRGALAASLLGRVGTIRAWAAGAQQQGRRVVEPASGRAALPVDEADGVSPWNTALP